MADKNDIGQGIVDLIRDHVTNMGEEPFGFEGLVQSKHDAGLLVFTFEDGSTYRAIIEQTWEARPVVQESTPERDPGPVLDEQEEQL